MEKFESNNFVQNFNEILKKKFRNKFFNKKFTFTFRIQIEKFCNVLKFL